MEKEQRNEQENGSAKIYFFMQIALAVISLVTIGIGSFYFEKYTEETITSLVITLLLGIVYGKVLQKHQGYWKEILLVHVFMMLVITAGFLMNGFLKPVAFAPVLIGSFLSTEAGLAAALFYSVTAVLYTMETGEILMLYLLVAGIWIYFLRSFFSENSLVKKGIGMIFLFAIQTDGAILFQYYMYRETGIRTAAIGGAVLAVLCGIFSFLFPLIERTYVGQKESGGLSKLKWKEKKERKKEKEEQIQDFQERKTREKKAGKMLLDESSELFTRLKENEELYQHCQRVAQIAERMAASIDADRTLTRAGALIHDIGKLENGEDYVIDGIALCQKEQIPESVIHLLEEHNVNFKLPSSKEAAAVMLADTLVSTMEFNQKKGKETDPEILVEKIFRIRKEKGSLENSGLSEIEIELMEEAMKKEVGVKNGGNGI